MKRFLALCAFGLPLLCADAGADVDVAGRVTAVTLFQDRAEITRQAPAEIVAGKQVVRFTAIPDSVRADSLRVKGSGAMPITILGVEHRNRALAYEASPRSRELEQKIEATKRELDLLQKGKERIDSERGLMTKVSLYAEVPAQGANVVRPRSATEMNEVLTFVSSTLARLDREGAEATQKADDKRRELGVLEREFNQLRPRRNSESVIEVTLTAGGAGRGTLDLTYQVGGASWHPAYNLEAKDDVAGTKLALAQYAILSQSTGEDWSEVAMTLSTARPHVGLARPQPGPVILDLALPIQQLLQKTAGSANAPVRYRDSDRPESRAVMQEAEDDKNIAAVEQSATVQQGPIVTFALTGAVSVKSDGSTEKVKLTDVSLEGSVVNVAVPAYTSEVYREATIKNTSEIPLLPGAVAIFVEGSFIGSHFLAFTPPGKEIQMPIGVSTTVLAKRTLLKKFEDDSGLVRSFRRIAVDYAIELENISKHRENVVVLEPGVVSRNDKILVKVNSIEPPPLAADDKSRIAKEPGIVEWRLPLNAGEKKRLSTATTVEFESAVAVSGLEGL